MTGALRNVFGKATVQGVLALGIMATAATLALTERIDGPSFLGLAIVVAGFYFRQPSPDKE